MKITILTLVLLLLASCNCSPKPEIVTIHGITIINDSNFISSKNDSYKPSIFINWSRQLNSTGICLSKTKEEPMPVVRNGVIANSFSLKCNQTIDTFKSGSNLNVLFTQADGIIDYNNKIQLIIPSKNLEIGKKYVFSIEAITIDSLKINESFFIHVMP